MSCGKRPYATEFAANSVLFVIRARDTTAGDRLEVAACSDCNAFHVQRKAQPPPPRPVVIPFDPTAPRRGRPARVPYNDD